MINCAHHLVGIHCIDVKLYNERGVLLVKPLLTAIGKLPYNSENKPQGLYFTKALFEGLIFGGAYVRRGLSTEENLRFKIDWASLIVGSKFTVFASFYFVFEGTFQVQAPGGLYLEGRFNEGFFVSPVWGAYIWRGLFSEFYSICTMYHIQSGHFCLSQKIMYIHLCFNLSKMSLPQVVHCG